MTEQNFAVFDTAIGTCGIVWGARGIVGMQLPEANATATRARVPSLSGGARSGAYN